MLTDKQIAWDASNAEQQDARRRPSTPNPLIFAVQTGSWYHRLLGSRGVRTPMMPSGRSRGRCPGCSHGWKHHTKAGNCRPSCACTNGANR